MRRREVRPMKRACRGCGQRRAKFRFRRVVKADRFHELCFRCYRSLVDGQRARRLTVQRAA